MHSSRRRGQRAAILAIPLAAQCRNRAKRRSHHREWDVDALHRRSVARDARDAAQHRLCELGCVSPASSNDELRDRRQVGPRVTEGVACCDEELIAADSRQRRGNRGQCGHRM